MFLLKEYQHNCKEAMERYFMSLSEEQQKYEKLPEELKNEYPINFPEKVWHDIFPQGDSNHEYFSKSTGHDKPCPNFCLKIPTGGGKTLMATYAIEMYFKYVLKKKTGFVLWVVPSEQIYSQTLDALKDRSHPYRERLDSVTGARVKVVTKKDSFSPQDVEENLVVLVLMLQSFSRDKLKKDMLKFFQDNGRFDDFFPLESDQKKQKALVDQFPNLDLESTFDSLLGGKVKTSFGNVVKILQPFIILDEGHKAKSELSNSAIAECNPVAVCELTATPTDIANVLFSVAGRELEREQMIKLDLHLIEKDTSEWQLLLNHAIEHLNLLQEKAHDYKEQSGIYIRPIHLIQVEATGKDQRKEGKIHADDVKEYLIATGKIREDEIAIKTSSKNDIEGIDLLSSQCPIRFIITKRALQEGWDCPYAYSLSVLGGSRSKTALTQLVGRVLRQPNARKTGISELDESYVFCLKDSSKELIKGIKNGFELDGMGDLVERIATKEPGKTLDLGERKKQTVRKKFKKSLKDFALPTFVVKDKSKKSGTRVIDFTRDILPEIDFTELDLSEFAESHLSGDEKSQEIVHSVGFRDIAEDMEEFLAIQEYKKKLKESPPLHTSFWVQSILDIVPNPWIAKEVVDKALKILDKKYKKHQIAQNQMFFLERLRKNLNGSSSIVGEINRLAKKVFLKKLKKDEIRFVLNYDSKILKPESYFEKEATRSKTMNVQMSLFEPVLLDSLNNLEEETVDQVEQKEKTFWWYRNKAKKDFYLVAWRRSKFYPDFILTLRNGQKDSFATIYLLETKGGHLLGNIDSEYKKELTELYHSDIQDAWIEQKEAFPKIPKQVFFKFVEESELKNTLNEIFQSS